MSRRIATDEDQSVTFVELFFDLIFVFAVTQIVQVIHHHLAWGEVGHGVVLFWLVWWAWTQFTWALNSADTTHPGVEAAMLAATAVTFAMAIAIPSSFTTDGLWFAATYAVVRIIGLAVYGRVAWEHAEKRAPLRRFVVLSVPGLIAVIAGGATAGDGRAWWWAAAVALDIAAASLAGSAEGWDIRPDHFGERHGLFVIIALGESLIVAATGLSGTDHDAATLITGALALVTTCSLWWLYFTGTKPRLDHAIASRAGAERTRAARDAYSILHFPILFGVVLIAVAVEEAVTHASDPLTGGARLALASGLLLFIGGSDATLGRVGHRPTTVGLAVLIASAAGVLLVRPPGAAWTLLAAATGASLLAAIRTAIDHR